MKKLRMVLMMIVAFGCYAAFAQCGDTPEVPEANCAMVYDIKIELKTTVGAPIKGYTFTSGGSACEDDAVEQVDAVCYRKPGRVTLKGMIEMSSCDCDSMYDGVLTLWNKKAKVYELVSGSMGFSYINIMGKKHTDVETFFIMPLPGIGTLGEGALFGAGFGKWDAKNQRIISISGNVIGTLSAPSCESKITCDVAAVYPCGVLEDETAELPTVAYGTWSIKYNKSLSKKLTEDGPSALPYPDYL